MIENLGPVWGHLVLNTFRLRRLALRVAGHLAAAAINPGTDLTGQPPSVGPCALAPAPRRDRLVLGRRGQAAATAIPMNLSPAVDTGPARWRRVSFWVWGTL